MVNPGHADKSLQGHQETAANRSGRESGLPDEEEGGRACDCLVYLLSPFPDPISASLLSLALSHLFLPPTLSASFPGFPSMGFHPL